MGTFNTNLEPSFKNRFFIKFINEPEINAWQPRKCSPIVWSSKTWEPIEITFYDALISPSITNILFKMMNKTEDLQIEISELDPIGAIIQKISIIASLHSVNLDGYDHEDSSIRKPSITIIPKSIQLK